MILNFLYQGTIVINKEDFNLKDLLHIFNNYDVNKFDSIVFK